MSYKNITVSGNNTVNADVDSRGVVRIKNDSNLSSCISNYKYYKVANEVKWAYRCVHNEQLNITTTSLAVEILGHYKAEDLITFVQVADLIYFPPNIPLQLILAYLKDKVKEHVNIIDCGDDVIVDDSNRKIWDTISKLPGIDKLL